MKNDMKPTWETVDFDDKTEQIPHVTTRPGWSNPLDSNVVLACEDYVEPDEDSEDDRVIYGIWRDITPRSFSSGMPISPMNLC